MVGGVPLDEWSGSGATRELQETIREFNALASKQTATMIRLTRMIAFLTILLVIGLVIQIAVTV